MKKKSLIYFCVILVLLNMIGCSKKQDKKEETNVISSKNETKHLTIYSMYNNPTIRKAIMGFKGTHIGVSIDYEVAMQELSEDNEADVVRSLITRILANDGPDILLLDGLPKNSFVDKGVLMDLSDILMEPYENQELISNIASNYVDNDKIYYMPIRFFVPLYLMSNDITDHTKSLSDLADYCQISNQKLMEQHSYQQIVTMLLCTYWNEIMNEDGFIDKEKLKQFMNNISEIAKKSEAIENDVEYSEKIAYSIQYAQKEGYIPYSNAYKEFCGDPQRILEEPIDTTITFAGEFFSIQNCNGITKEAGGIYTPINQIFLPNGLVGVNVNTKNAELSKEFVTYLFSENIQSLNPAVGEPLDGFPMSSKALDNWINDENGADCAYSLIDYNGKQRNLLFKKFTVLEKREESRLFDSLTRPVYDNEICINMIVEGTIDYFSGKKNLDQALSDIINKVNLYLEE